MLSVWALDGAGVPGVKPVIVELTDFKTKEKVDELEVDAVLVATGRAPYTQARLLSSHVTIAECGNISLLRLLQVIYDQTAPCVVRKQGWKALSSFFGRLQCMVCP